MSSRLFSWGEVCIRTNPKAGTASGTFGSRRDPHGTQDAAHLCVPVLLCLSLNTLWQHLAVRCGLDEAEIFFSRQALNYALPIQSNGDGSWDLVSLLGNWKSFGNPSKILRSTSTFEGHWRVHVLKFHSCCATKDRYQSNKYNVVSMLRQRRDFTLSLLNCSSNGSLCSELSTVLTTTTRTTTKVYGISKPELSPPRSSTSIALFQITV